ncbi:hypothetical protein KC318_g8 [Hortaea werneckii]|nr:hypothetical protein KC334_g8 [Hortaea werneckii]KAI7028382.1 hypothetical protein KC355_g8 [Hortaea werneckii]KAI7676800.1 hypothetical protein KC318_g8 [Hortaea werneckii]
MSICALASVPAFVKGYFLKSLLAMDDVWEICWLLIVAEIEACITITSANIAIAYSTIGSWVKRINACFITNVPSDFNLTTRGYSKSKIDDIVKEDTYHSRDGAAIRDGVAGSTTFIRHAPRKSVMAEQEHHDDDCSQKGILGEDDRNEDEAGDTQFVHGNGIRRIVEFQVRSSPGSSAEASDRRGPLGPGPEVLLCDMLRDQCDCYALSGGLKFQALSFLSYSVQRRGTNTINPVPSAFYVRL